MSLYDLEESQGQQHQQMGQLGPAIGKVLFPETQGMSQEIKAAKEDIKDYAYAQIGLQTLAAAATFGMFLIALFTFAKKREKGIL